MHFTYTVDPGVNKRRLQISADRRLGWTGAAAAATQTHTHTAGRLWRVSGGYINRLRRCHRKHKKHQEFASVAAPVLAELLFSQGSRSFRSVRVISETGSHLAGCVWGTEGFLARMVFDKNHRCVSCASFKEQRWRSSAVRALS